MRFFIIFATKNIYSTPKDQDKLKKHTNRILMQWNRFWSALGTSLAFLFVYK